jgi:hypothetical protein
MVLIRTILAALIAFSVAVLPATGEAIALSSADQSMMSNQSDMSCCPCCNTQDVLKLAACALKCVGIVGAVLPALTLTPLYFADGASLPFVDHPLHEFFKAPPTHPPSR